MIVILDESWFQRNYRQIMKGYSWTNVAAFCPKTRKAINVTPYIAKWAKPDCTIYSAILGLFIM